jgi:hypothetical protein
MSEIALDHDRKVAVSEALGLSWARVLALRPLATRPRGHAATRPRGHAATLRVLERLGR